MDKQSLIMVLNEYFSEEGNCALIHLNDGSELLIAKKPNYFNLHMSVDYSYDVNGEIVNEKFIIPYSSVLYVTLSNFENFKILAKQYEPLKTNDDVFFYDDLTEKIE